MGFDCSVKVIASFYWKKVQKCINYYSFTSPHIGTLTSMMQPFCPLSKVYIQCTDVVTGQDVCCIYTLSLTVFKQQTHTNKNQQLHHYITTYACTSLCLPRLTCFFIHSISISIIIRSDRTALSSIDNNKSCFKFDLPNSTTKFTTILYSLD